MKVNLAGRQTARQLSDETLLHKRLQEIPERLAHYLPPMGRLPLMVILSGCVMVAIATAATLSRTDSPWGQVLFWIALCSLFGVSMSRMLSTRPSRQERIVILLLVGLTCYSIKILSYPTHFAYFDEFLHWQTARDILDTHHLFTNNPLLPISPLYPGLEIVTSAIVQVTGLSVTDAGFILIGLARVLLMVSLYLLLEEITRSSRVAGVGALLYTCHTNFLFFSSEFSYESLALPLATFVLFMIARRVHRRDFHPDRFIILIGFPVVSVAIMHHLTGYALAVVTLLWTVVTFIRLKGQRGWLDLALVGGLILAATAGWTAFVGNATVDYLGPVIRGGMSELLGFITGEATGRQLFQSASGISAPLWERITSVMAVAMILFMLPFGLIIIWLRYRRQTLALALGSLVVLYPVMQLFRLTSRGWELASRSAAVLFWGISFVLAVAFISFLAQRSAVIRRFIRLMATVYITIIFVGSALSGWPSWARLPGPYMPSADSQSIEKEGLTAAQWVGDHLPANSRIGADRVNMLLMSAWGRQRPVTHLNDNVDISDVYFARTFGDKEIALLKSVDTRYLVVDSRLSAGLPIMGAYFESTENGGQRHTTPIAPELLSKFSAVPGADQLYDSGHIRIYDMSRIVDGP